MADGFLDLLDKGSRLYNRYEARKAFEKEYGQSPETVGLSQDTESRKLANAQTSRNLYQSKLKEQQDASNLAARRKTAQAIGQGGAGLDPETVKMLNSGDPSLMDAGLQIVKNKMGLIDQNQQLAEPARQFKAGQSAKDREQQTATQLRSEAGLGERQQDYLGAQSDMAQATRDYAGDVEATRQAGVANIMESLYPGQGQDIAAGGLENLFTPAPNPASTDQYNATQAGVSIPGAGTVGQSDRIRQAILDQAAALQADVQGELSQVSGPPEMDLLQAGTEQYLQNRNQPVERNRRGQVISGGVQRPSNNRSQAPTYIEGNEPSPVQRNRRGQKVRFQDFVAPPQQQPTESAEALKAMDKILRAAQ